MAASEASNELSKSVAKWLIPSFGVLFALLGYVVHTAHRSLLGFPAGADGAPAAGYATDAADFLRYVLTLIGDDFVAFASFQGVPLGGHGLAVALCASAAAAAIAYALSKYGRANARRSAQVLGTVLFALLITKFVNFDAPLMRVENVIVGVGVDEQRQAARNATTESLPARLAGSKAGALDSWISGRAIEVWRLLVCSRITGAIENHPEFGGKKKCKADSGASKTLLAGEFTAQLALGLMIAVCALMLLRARIAAATAVALIGFAYLLTVPYAYGKLLKPVDFPYALVRFAEDSLLRDARDRVYAFVIARTGSDVTLLEAVDEKCSAGSSKVLRFSSLPMGKLTSIEQIYVRDVLTWAALSEQRCSPISPPGGTL